MESQVYDVLLTEYLYSLKKCEEVLHLWEMKMAKLECQVNSRKEHSKLNRLKVASNSRCRIGSGCVCYIANTTSRKREMHRIMDHLNQRLKILEEEMESMKQAILWQVKERRRLVNKIHHYFHCIQLMLWQRSGVKGEQLCHDKLIMSPSKDGRAVAGLPEVLCPDFNPSLITEGLQANNYFSKKLQTTPTYL